MQPPKIFSSSIKSENQHFCILCAQFDEKMEGGVPTAVGVMGHGVDATIFFSVFDTLGCHFEEKIYACYGDETYGTNI